MQQLIENANRCGGAYLPPMQQARGGLLVLVALLALSVTQLAWAQGMPPEARQNIHALFNGHEQIQRTLVLTEDGYEATTLSTNGTVARALQTHVKQMQERLDSGLAARRWDPAFAEYRAYYDQIDVSIEAIEGGVRIVAKGQTANAVKVAQNHARVINAFVSDGWAAHNSTHAAALNSTQESQAGDPTGCCGRLQSGCGGACGGSGSKCSNH